MQKQASKTKQMGFDVHPPPPPPPCQSLIATVTFLFGHELLHSGPLGAETLSLALSLSSV